MANTVSNVYVQTFERNVRFLAQQKGSRMLPWTTKKGEQSQKHNFERVGKLTATTKAGRGVASPVNDTPFDRRVVTPVTKHVGDLVEPEDVVQLLIDPVSAITTAVGYALGRAIDDLIIAAATGNALDGVGGTPAFPAGQLVGDGTGAISLLLTSQVMQVFLTNDIFPEDGEKCMFVGPVQARQLLSIQQATSRDYVESKALADNGMVKNWMGFNWYVSNRLTVPAGGQLSCLAFTQRALGFNMQKDIWARVQEDPSVSFAMRIYSAFTGGCVRVEDEHIVHFKLLNS
jgi:hypothetical protein